MCQGGDVRADGTQATTCTASTISAESYVPPQFNVATLIAAQAAAAAAAEDGPRIRKLLQGRRDRRDQLAKAVGAWLLDVERGAGVDDDIAEWRQEYKEWCKGGAAAAPPPWREPPPYEAWGPAAGAAAEEPAGDAGSDAGADAGSSFLWAPTRPGASVASMFSSTQPTEASQSPRRGSEPHRSMFSDTSDGSDGGSSCRGRAELAGGGGGD